MIPTDLTPRILQGHVIDVLRTLPEGSVQCAVTSPPYWGLRAYGTEPQVWGGDPNHAHLWPVAVTNGERKDPDAFIKYKWRNTGLEGGVPEGQASPYVGNGKASGSCSCGAWRGELGLEPTPHLYVAHLVEVFREVRRVLRDDGTLWLNLGDTYSGGNNGYNPGAPSNQNGASLQSRGQGDRGSERNPTWATTKFRDSGLPIKNLVGIPWRVALALQDDGWWLRSDILWSKPNPMPESVTDRPTRSHEYIFLLTKSARYFYDQDAVRGTLADSSAARLAQESFWDQTGGPKDYGPDSNRSARRALENMARRNGYSPSTLREVAEGYDGSATKDYAGAGVQDPSALKARIIDGIRRKGATGFTDGVCDGCGRPEAQHVVSAKSSMTQFGADADRVGRPVPCNVSGPNLKTVWHIATQPYHEAHFATFPQEIPRRAILLGTSEKGACAKCGAPWEREIEPTGEIVPAQDPNGANAYRLKDLNVQPSSTPMVKADGIEKGARSLGRAVLRYHGWAPTCSCGSAEVVPCVVLDPFSGSGTVAQVARSLSRRAIGIDLNESYVSLARSRSGADTPSLERFEGQGAAP